MRKRGQGWAGGKVDVTPKSRPCPGPPCSLGWDHVFSSSLVTLEEDCVHRTSWLSLSIYLFALYLSVITVY